MRDRSDRGFTLIELLVGLLLGTIILSAAITFLITHMRSLEGSDTRENVARNDRYVGALLRRDLQLAGIGIKSGTRYGTLSVWPGTSGDTLIVLYVPYQPEPAPLHPVDPTESQPADAGEGTCGPRCIEVLYDPTKPKELLVGDLARMEVEGVRRLVLINDLRIDGPEWEIEWTEADSLLHQPAGLTGTPNVQLKVPGTFVQKLAVVIFYLDGERLMRADELNLDGSPSGQVVAYGVEEFDISLIFADGDTLGRANPSDTDYSNDYDDIAGVIAVVTVRASRVDPRVNNGQLVRKTSEWRVSPRNLRYEKNRY